MTAEEPRAGLAELDAARHRDPQLAREFRALLQRDPHALHRESGPRHLTASAVVIDAPAEHVALVWHRKGRFWVQPGGHLEPGETSFEQAARREVREEIGLDALERVGPGPALLQRHGLDAGFGACQEHWDVVYLLRATLPAAQLPLTASEESPEVIWAAVDAALPQGTVADLRPALDRLLGYPAS